MWSAFFRQSIRERALKLRLSNIKLPEGTTLDALVLAEIDVKSNERVLKVPTTALVFHDNQQYVVKNSTKPTTCGGGGSGERNGKTKVPCGPGKKTICARPDDIAIKGAIFVFGSLKKKQPAA